MNDTLKAVVPAPLRHGLRSMYWGARRWDERQPQQIGLKRIVAEFGDEVQLGPFAGMRSLTTMDDGCIIPKLIGCYEEEIHHWIDFIIDRSPRRVIDVGCASGWYTTGFAWRLPESEIIGFDLDDDALARARELATLNGVAERVSLRRQRLEPRSLGELIDPTGTTVLIDIDGPEIDLLVPEEDPRLLDADILVEFHDHFNPAISDTIVGRFEKTHDIQRLFATGRDPAHYRALDGVRTRWVRDAAVAERRPCNPRQEFALMVRR